MRNGRRGRFEAELRSAARPGEAFDVATGEPVSWGRVSDNLSWYDFCVSYVDMKWSDASAHHRANIAWTLVTVIPAMLTTDRGKPEEVAMRTALRKWGFNTKQRPDCPDNAATILTWLSRSTKPVAALADPATMRAVLTTAGTLLDGTPAAPSTVRRNRTILHNALEYLPARNVVEAVVHVGSCHPCGALVTRLRKACQRITDAEAMPVREAPWQQQRVNDRVEFDEQRALHDPVREHRDGDFILPILAVAFWDHRFLRCLVPG